MRTLQGPGRDNEPDPFASLVKQIADLRRGIDDATAQVLRMAGLRAEPDLLRVLGSLVVEGALNVTGDTVIGGTLSLPAGIIGNDALANPLAVAAAQNSAGGWGLPAAEATLASSSITVPDGFSHAAVAVFVNFSILGSAGSGNSYVRCRAVASTQYGYESTAFLYDTDAITMSAFGLFSFSTLAGGTIPIYAQAYALAGAKPAIASNLAVVGGLALFTR